MTSGPSGRSEGLAGASEPSPESSDQDPRRWGMLVLLSAAVLLGMSEWFTASAIATELQARWGLSSGQVGWLTTAVQLGFVAGTALASVLNLADVFPSRAYFATSSLAAAGANAALLVVGGFETALGARFFTGFFLAGVYPPGMKMIATWFRSARGLAIGTVVGALTVGKATPYLLKVAGGAGADPVIGGASVAGVLAGLIVLLGYRDGPYPFARSAFSWGLVGRILRHRPTMLATGGYLGHMWELYAAWGSIGLFFLAFFEADARHSPAADLAAFGMIAAGGLGAVMAGRWADRWGRERTTVWMMAVSGICASCIGWMVGVSAWIVVPLALVWGFTIVADSAQFSACVTEVCPQESVGTALTLQTSLGFALTGFSIQLTAYLSEAAGWGWAYSALALGPLAGIVSMEKLRTLRRSRHAEGGR